MATKVKTQAQQVLVNAQEDVKQEAREAIMKAAEEVIKGPVTFSIEGRLYKAPEHIGRMSYSLQQSEIDVYGKWRNLEPEVSELFEAPECYTDITSEEYKAIRRFLEITNPLYNDAFNTVKGLIERDKRGSKLPPLTQGERYQLDGARGRLEDARRAVNRAYETIKRHYEKRQAAMNADSSESKTRQRTSPRGLIDKTVASLQKMVESSKTAPADKDMARDGLSALRWVLTYRNDFQMAYMQHLSRIAVGQKEPAQAASLTK
jgi:hypothetical protein